MKFACFLLFLLLLSSCKRDNPLEKYTGIWISGSSNGRDINIRSFFFLTLTNKQLESENIRLENNTLTISHAEYCSPFLQGEWKFHLKKQDDSTIVLTPLKPLPTLFRRGIESHTKGIILKKCRTKFRFRPQSIGIVSYVSDSLNPINSTIDWTGKTRLYKQSLTHRNHKLFPVYMIGKCQTRKLKDYEGIILEELLKYSYLDTLPFPRGVIGCRMGPYFFDFSFKYKGKTYLIQNGVDLTNSDPAIIGLLLSASRKNGWTSSRLAHSFCITQCDKQRLKTDFSPFQFKPSN